MIEAKTKRPPLYKKVTDQLREQCFAYSGQMLPSLRQLSQTLEVNHATISRALRDLEQEGIVEIVPRKGIFSTPRPTTGTNAELVVVVSARSHPLDVAQRIMEGMESECLELAACGIEAKASRSVLSFPPMPDPDRFVAELRSRGVAGIVILGLGFFDGQAAEEEDQFVVAVAQKMPVVLAGSPHPNLDLDCIYGDPRTQLEEFLEHCYDRGLRRFEYLGDRGDNLLQRERRDAFRDFLVGKGLGWQWDDLKRAADADLASHLRSLSDFPEVVVATNIKRALSVTLEAQRRGLHLPDELQILCFASLMEHAQPLLPYISVIMLDEPGVGVRAMQILSDRLKGQRDSDALTDRVPAHFVSGPIQCEAEHSLNCAA